MKKLVLLVVLLFFISMIPNVQGWTFVDLSTFTEQDTLNRITHNSTRVNITGMRLGDDNTYLAKDYGQYFFGTKFKVNVTTNLSSPMTVGAQGVIVAWSNQLSDVFNCKGDSIIYVRYYYHEGDNKRRFQVGGYEDDVESYANGNVGLSFDTYYYLTVTRVGDTLTCDIYSDIARSTLIESISKSGLSSDYYRYMYAAQSVDDGDNTHVVTFHSMNFNLSNSTVEKPTLFNTNCTGNSTINITWDMGANSTHTVIERNTKQYWGLGEGTEIYNGTSDSYDDTGLSKGVTYYYQAWGYNTSSNWYSNNVSNSNITGPNNPTSVTGSLTGTTMNFTWTSGTLGADRTIIVSNINSYTTGPTEGTEEYNGTASSCDITDVTTNYYYTFYSFNTTVHRFSNGTNFEYGSLNVSVYDEADGSALTNWGFFIKNNDGSSTYTNTSCTNPLVLDTDQLPTGNDCSIIINLTGYDTRTFYMDINDNTAYTLNAYLVSNTTTEDYVFRVIDESDNSVSGAEINIRRVINGSYENVTIAITDGNGYCTVSLVEEANYLCIISKSGFTTAYKDFYAITIDYEADRYNTFKIFHTTPDYNNSDIWSQIITFNGYMSDTSFYVNYTDSNNDTTSTAIILYEITDDGRTAVGWDNRTSDNDFTVTFTGLNSSNCHQASIVVTHSFFGDSKQQSFIDCTGQTTLTTDTEFDNIFDNIFKSIPFGWSNLVGLIFLMFMLFAFDYRNAGIALILSGFVMSGINYVVGLTLIGLTIPIVFIILGIVAQWNTHRREMGT